MISLIQGILTKNTNVIKLPREGGLILPFMASQIAYHVYQKDKLKIEGSKIMNSCLFVYCNKQDIEAQKNCQLIAI